MWWKIPIALGVGTGVGVGLQGGSLGRSLGWAALTTGLTSVLSSGRTWRAAWAGTRWAAPYVARVGVYAVSDIGIMGTAFTTTRTAAALGSGATVVAAVGVGYTVGAVTGTIIVSQAEKKELVYEGATADVLDFYTGEGQYWAQGEDDPTPGYFNIPGNASLIAKHYWNKWV